MIDDLDMYGAAEEGSEETGNQEIKFDAKTRGLTIELVIDGQKVIVPHVDYVSTLERQLAMTEALVKQLRTDVIRLRQTVREHAAGMHGMRRNLDTKIDRG